MDIIVNFGYRSYVFHSQENLTKATSIYAHCMGTMDDFENELEKANIDFEYNI